MDVSLHERGVLAFGAYRLDPVRRTLARCGQDVALTPRLFDTLVYLVQNPERLVTRDELEAAVWGGRVVEEGNLQKAISALRKALLAAGACENLIVTVPGRGFRFAVPVSFEAEAAEAEAPDPSAGTEPAASPESPRPARSRLVWAAAGFGAASLAVASGLVWHFASRPAGFTPPPHSIAVLAFTNMNGDAGQAYFSDGISEDLIGALGRLDGLKVAGRVSAFSFKGSHATAAEIGRKLDVATVLEGSVRRDGDNVRITAELIDTTTGFQLWSQCYDRQQGSVLRMQDDIAARVTQSLRLKLLGDASAQLMLGGTANAKAFDAYLRGRSIDETSPTTQDMVAAKSAALAAFDQALALDPTYALAEGARSELLCSLSSSGRFSPSRRQRLVQDGVRAARRAVFLAPDMGMAHAQLAYVLHYCLFDFADAGAELARAVALEPGNADVLSAVSSLASETGLGTALPMAQLRVTLDPLNPRTYYDFAKALYHSRRYDEAAASLDHAASLRGGASVIEDDLRGMIELMRGDPARTVAICGGARNWHENVELAIAYRKLGRLEEATASAAKVHDVLREAGAFQYAEIAAQWGNKDEALGWLEAAYQLRDAGLPRINTDPWLDPVRDTPRFRDIVRKLHLPT